MPRPVCLFTGPWEDLRLQAALVSAPERRAVRMKAVRQRRVVTA